MLLIFILVILTIAVYWYGTRTFSYWAKRGVKHDPPVPFFGTAKRQLLREISYSEIYDEMYLKYPKEKYVGYYFSTRPLLILRDPEVIKRVLVTDFQYFYSRSVFPRNDGGEPLLDNLFGCTGDLWKLVRQRLTPAFTSGKLKAMFPMIVTRAEKLLELASTESAQGTEVDVHDLMARYTTDFIGACGFGLDTDALDDKNSMFRQIGHRMFNNTTGDSVRMFCKFMMPTLFKNAHFVCEFVEKNIIKLITGIMKERDYKPVGRNDFIDLMLELKTKGKITGESLTKKNPDGTPCVVEREFDDMLIVAQVGVFFAAGFETSSNSSSYLLHVLAYHPEHQEKCQKEIDDVLARYDNKLSYDAVKEMKYLAMCFSEGMRLNAPLGYLMRECEKTFTIPDTDITLDPGVQVIIPVQSLHMDPEHWDEPEQFRPERFHPDNIANIKKYTYLPFGEGPRNCIAVYWYGTRTFSYWAKRGVKHDPPVPFFGTAKRQLLREISYSEIYDEMYLKYPKEKYVGYYFSTRPLLILRDPEVIKRVLVTDFQYFYSRSVFPRNDGGEPLLDNLFGCTGDLWKLVRQRLTPAFTSGKLKAMFPMIVTRAEKLLELASTESAQGTEVDVHDLMARYTTDFIGACGFGLDTDALDDKNSMFRQIGHRMFNNTTGDSVRMFCKFMMPTLFKNAHFVCEFVEKNIIKLITGIMKERDYKPVGRNDFIDLMLELKTKGKITGESLTKKNPDGTPCVVEREFDDMLIVAQVGVFFAAGFETSSNSSSYLLHVLAYHPEHQEKCQKEIDDVLARYDNKLSYDAVKEMKYLAMCFSEGMRLNAPLGYLMRECEKTFTIPDTDITLDPGVQVIIPVQSLHMDPEHWDEPEQFRPERFHPDNIANIKKYTYLPFGEGPRNCIGERLGYMQSLAGIAALLSRFTFTPGKKTVRHPPLDPAVFIVQSVAGGLPLIMTHRKKIQ